MYRSMCHWDDLACRLQCCLVRITASDLAVLGHTLYGSPVYRFGSDLFLFGVYTAEATLCRSWRVAQPTT
jgi:hypothetical protein